MSKRTVSITAEDVGRMRQAEADEKPGSGTPRAFMDEARKTLKRMGLNGYPTKVTVTDGWPDPTYELTFLETIQ